MRISYLRLGDLDDSDEKFRSTDRKIEDIKEKINEIIECINEMEVEK